MPLNIETEMIISLLKLTKERAVSHEQLKREARAPSEVAEKLLGRLQDEGLVYLRDNFVGANELQRLRLAIYAIEYGADFERVSSLLHWKEFEGIAATAFERNGYEVRRNLRFKQGGRRWEIDVVGCKKPLAVCVDCKHWHRGLHPSSLRKVVEEQTERTRALAESLPNPTVRIECLAEGGTRFVPAILSLVGGGPKFHNSVPVVPILQLQDFLNQLPAHVGSLKSFHSSRGSFRIDS